MTQGPVRPGQPEITHRGGCAFCLWWIKNRCTHAAYPLPTPFVEAREPGQPCGPSGRLWQFRAGSDRP